MAGHVVCACSCFTLQYNINANFTADRRLKLFRRRLTVKPTDSDAFTLPPISATLLQRVAFHRCFEHDASLTVGTGQKWKHRNLQLPLSSSPHWHRRTTKLPGWTHAPLQHLIKPQKNVIHFPASRWFMCVANGKRVQFYNKWPTSLGGPISRKKARKYCLWISSCLHPSVLTWLSTD